MLLLSMLLLFSIIEQIDKSTFNSSLTHVELNHFTLGALLFDIIITLVQHN